MAKAIPPVRCNIIFAKCTCRPSIVLSLFLSASGRARVRDERGRRTIFVELISARNNGNANVICCILGDLPNEGAVVFVIFLNRRRTCVVCVVRLPVFRFRNFLADGFPSSSIPRDVTSIRTSEYLGTHILSRRTPKTRAPPAPATALYHSRHYSHPIVLRLSSSLVLVASAICNPVRHVYRHRRWRWRWASSSASMDTWASLDLT